MGKPTYTVGQQASVVPPVTSTVLAAVTAFLGLLVKFLSLVPNGFMKGIQRVVSIIWALVGFGYMVDQLVSALQADQVAQEDVARSLDELQKVDVMNPIPPPIPLDASEGCLSRTQCFSFLDKGHISQEAEQHFEQVSQSATSTVFSGEAPNLPSSMAETAASKPSQALFSGPCYSSLSARTHSGPRGRQLAQAVAQARDASPPPQIELQVSQPHTQGAMSQHTVVAEARSFNTKAGATKAALMDTLLNWALLLFHRDDAT
ncbi:putative transmembrane protein [Rhizoctonia solani 123E]|uniref:Putative transmembrane protein n=1 Tax=Rhizoctonia solani 123E TaxID=1423351 RepID=A0A074RN48_9AGAM|nr:putative transmembrane protein [Rhizoctonia solani 123E]